MLLPRATIGQQIGYKSPYVFTTFDNKLFQLVFYQHSVLGGYFSNIAESSYYISEYKYSLLSELDNSSRIYRTNDKFEFLLHWPSEGQYKHWRQLNSLMSVHEEYERTDESDQFVEGFENITETRATPYWGGMMRSFYTYNSLLDGQPNDWHWDFAVGVVSQQYYPNMPCSISKCNETALYVRVESIPYDCATCIANYNYNNTFSLYIFVFILM